MILRHEAKGLPRGAKVNVLSGKRAVITRAPVADRCFCHKVASTLSFEVKNDGLSSLGETF